MVKEVKKECENERITHLLLVHLQDQMGSSKERERVLKIKQEREKDWNGVQEAQRGQKKKRGKKTDKTVRERERDCFNPNSILVTVTILTYPRRLIWPPMVCL